MDKSSQIIFESAEGTEKVQNRKTLGPVFRFTFRAFRVFRGQHCSYLWKNSTQLAGERTA